ncbi:hypothetical protein BV338_05723 [Pseudomonas syringae pv. actinidiae]|nr:hypothetical protein BV338_05723 [Pseudomonas syringae pv. actinidiae]
MVCAQVDHAAGAFLVQFARVLRRLGQGLGVANTDAHRHARPAPDTRLDFPREVPKRLRNASEIRKALID